MLQHLPGGVLGPLGDPPLKRTGKALDHSLKFSVGVTAPEQLYKMFAQRFVGSHNVLVL
jgi:hypothetical protein